MRANTLAKGYSGTRPEVAQRLLDFLEHGVLPEVPSRGSVGASGDLAPLAHLALPLVGEGRARVGGELLSGADALARAGLEPLRLQAKEGLSLVNGTQFMGAFAALGLVRPRGLRRPPTSPAPSRSRRCRARATASCRRSTSSGRCAARRHPRPTSWRCSRARRSSSRTAGATRSRTRTRCAAPRRCTARRATCSTTSSTPPSRAERGDRQPARLRRGRRCSSRTGTSTASRSASRSTRWRWRSASSPASPSAASERLVNPALSGGLPAFLTADGGLNSGFMIPQYVAASLVSENKALCHPASVDSIPTSAGPGRSRVDGQRLRAEGVAGAGERRVRPSRSSCSPAPRPSSSTLRSQPGVGGRAAREFVRSLSPRLRDDRSLTDDIEAVAAAIRDGSAVSAVEAETGALQ